VRVNNGGVFILDGGEVSNNATVGTAVAVANGGGVRIEAGGMFDMRRGTIFGNSGLNGGGVFVTGTANPGIFRISNGTIYGDGILVDVDLRNTSRTPGSASLSNAGTSLRGTFANGDFTQLGVLTTTAETIEVEDGVLQ